MVVINGLISVFFAETSANSFPEMPECLGTQIQKILGYDCIKLFLISIALDSVLFILSIDFKQDNESEHMANLPCLAMTNLIASKIAINSAENIDE